MRGRGERDAGSIRAASIKASFAGILRRDGGNDSLFPLVDHLAHDARELLDVPVGVDVARRLDRLVAEQLLDSLQVPGLVEDALPLQCWPCACAPRRSRPRRRSRHTWGQQYHPSWRPWKPIGWSPKMRITVFPFARDRRPRREKDRERAPLVVEVPELHAPERAVLSP